MMAEMKYEIVQELGVIKESGNWATKVCLVSWNGKPAKVDIRAWNETPDAKYKVGKGITLSDEEAIRLIEVLKENGYAKENE